MSEQYPGAPAYPPGYPDQPPYPGYPPGYPAYPPHSAPPRTRAQKWDYGISFTLWVVYAVFLGMFWLYSGLAVMATDACTPSKCNDTLIGGAYIVGWVGAGSAALGSLDRMERAKNNGSRVWPWCLGGVMATIACVFGFFAMLGAGTGFPIL